MRQVFAWPEAYRATVESEFYLRSATLSSTSPYTGEQTVYEPDVQRFVAQLALPTLKGYQARELSGFITSLRGQAGLIRLVDYHRMRPGFDEENKPAGGWGPADGILPAFVAAAEDRASGNNDLLLTGYGAAIVRAFRAGDRVEIRPAGGAVSHGHYYEGIADSHTNGDGETRIYFEPGLRVGVQSGDQVVIRFPTSVFRLGSDTDGKILRRAPGNTGTMGLTAAEVMPEDEF